MKADQRLLQLSQQHRHIGRERPKELVHLTVIYSQNKTFFAIAEGRFGHPLKKSHIIRADMAVGLSSPGSDIINECYLASTGSRVHKNLFDAISAFRPVTG